MLPAGQRKRAWGGEQGACTVVGGSTEYNWIFAYIEESLH